jgi:hypothetical protein
MKEWKIFISAAPDHDAWPIVEPYTITAETREEAEKIAVSNSVAAGRPVIYQVERP